MSKRSERAGAAAEAQPSVTPRPPRVSDHFGPLHTRSDTLASRLREIGGDVPPAEAHPPGRVSYVYKDGKQPKEATRYGPDGTARERIVFQYDPRGNWISKTYVSLTAAGAQRAEYRTITYF